MGGQRCKTCRHPRLLEIHRLRDGGATLHALSDAFGLSVGTINRHLNQAQVEGHPCRARFEAVACAAVAGEMAASDRPVPPPAPSMRRRAIAGGPRSVQPVARPDNDPSGPAAASIMPFHAAPTASVVPTRKSPPPAHDRELSLLASFGATDQHLAELVGCGASDVAGIIGESRGDDQALFGTTNQQWAKHFVRLAMEELINLRRRRQDALDGRRWREAERFDPKIAKANNDLFLTLQRFGLVGPISPDELSKEGDDMRDILGMVVATVGAREPLMLTEKQEGCVDREMRRLADRQRAIA